MLLKDNEELRLLYLNAPVLGKFSEKKREGIDHANRLVRSRIQQKTQHLFQQRTSVPSFVISQGDIFEIIVKHLSRNLDHVSHLVLFSTSIFKTDHFCSKFQYSKCQDYNLKFSNDEDAN